MSTITSLLHSSRLPHGFDVMSSPYSDPDCNCIPGKPCAKHAVLISSRFDQAQAASMSPEIRLQAREYSRMAQQIARPSAIAPPGLSPATSRAPQTSSWDMNYTGRPNQNELTDDTFGQDPTDWNPQIHTTTLPFAQAVGEDLQTAGSVSLMGNSMLPNASGAPTAPNTLSSTQYYGMFDTSNNMPYDWIPPQTWVHGTDMPSGQYWDNNIISSDHLRGYRPGSLPDTPSGHEGSVHSVSVEPTGESTAWSHASMSPVSSRYPVPLQVPAVPVSQMTPSGTPPRYWMVRTDSAVTEENGALFIELDGTIGTRERVPAARFEVVFQDALQDNRTSPISMREAWQIRKEDGKSTITYTGTCPAGVIKTRKSTVFAPFIGLYQGRHCVMLVDDTDGSGSPRLRALRSSPYLPDTMSTREAGWLMEAILRRDWTITIEDVMDRMLSRIRLDISTYNRWRRHDKAVYEFEDDPRSRY